MKALTEKIHCKCCGSENIVGYGSYHGIPRFWCKDCKHKFADNNALPKYKTPVEQVTHALASFYNGNSLNDIKNELESQYGSKITEAAVYYWVRQQSDKAVAVTNQLKPTVGDVWIADETAVPVGTGKRTYWLIDVVDRDTRFLLATRLSKTRTIRDIELTMLEAKERAGKSPKTILSDGWHAYPDGIERAFGSDTKHIQSNPFADKNSTVFIERVQGSLKDRTKVFRALKKKNTAQTILDGWVAYYNFFRPHLSLSEKTPAEVAGIDYFTNWGDFIRSQLPKQLSTEPKLRNRNDIPELLKQKDPLEINRILGLPSDKAILRQIDRVTNGLPATPKLHRHRRIWR
jgi:transposase-like protein